MVLAIVLTSSGLRLTLKGKGPTVYLMCFIPFLCEATLHGFLGQVTFGMPPAVAFTLGFSVAAIATSVITSVLVPLADKGYGTEKDVVFTILASCPFENVNPLSKMVQQE